VGEHGECFGFAMFVFEFGKILFSGFTLTNKQHGGFGKGPTLVTFLDVHIDPSQTILIALAQGNTFRTPLVTIADFRIGGFQIDHVTTIVLEFPSVLKIDGIVGMNVL
jgi:hypothetical protein